MTTSKEHVAWIAVDWGTSNLRVWLMDTENEVADQRSSDQGMGGLCPAEFERTLASLVNDVLTPSPLRAVICGMAGAKQGWAEAPYSAVPCKPPGIERATRVTSDRFEAYILPGVKQPRPADVMRGEETQIAGFLTNESDFDGVLCLPGTHTKWVHVSAGEIVSFRTFMTGELFALINAQSVLRHSVGGSDWDQAAFDGALADTLAHPNSLASGLFALRAEGLLNGLPASAARARLSALLIGAELVAAGPYWQGRDSVIIGAGGISKSYHAALSAQGAPVRCVDAADLTLAGLSAANNELGKVIV